MFLCNIRYVLLLDSIRQCEGVACLLQNSSGKDVSVKPARGNNKVWDIVKTKSQIQSNPSTNSRNWTEPMENFLKFPTFAPSTFLRGAMTKKTLRVFFLETPCIFIGTYNHYIITTLINFIERYYSRWPQVKFQQRTPHQSPRSSRPFPRSCMSRTTNNG